MRIVVRLLQAALAACLVAAVFLGIRSATADDGPGATAGDRPGSSWSPASSPGERLVIGPHGLGRLKLGMSAQEAYATGELESRPDLGPGSSPCQQQGRDGFRAHLSRDHGLAILSGPPETRTPEGIRAGASFAEVVAVYPKSDRPEYGTPRESVEIGGYHAAPVPGNPDAVYLFVFQDSRPVDAGDARRLSVDPDDATLALIMLSLREQGGQCTKAG